MRIEEMERERRWRAHKQILRSSAEMVQERLFLHEKYEDIDGGDCPKNVEGALGHISKVVWQNLVPRAKVLLSRCPLARQHSEITHGAGGSRVTLRDPQLFSDAFDKVRARRAAEGLARRACGPQA